MTDNSRLFGRASNDGRESGAAPKLSYMAMYTRGDGLSSLARCQLAGFDLGSIGGKAAPMWMQRFPGEPKQVWFTVLPVGWVGDWHESPAPQWVCALSGHWWIETADGQRVEMGPGEIHWGRDQGTSGGRGHRSGQLGDEPCVQIMVRYEHAQGKPGPCPFDDVLA